MVDPIIALSIAAAGLAVLWVLFRPVKGYVWQWQRAMQLTERVLIEDALKHLYDYEYKKWSCTLQSMSGALSIEGDRAAKLAGRLEELGLVKSSGQGLELTDEGRSYALRMVRVHRLWERYLADKTGLPAQEWHSEAEKQEHRLSQGEANALAEQMGHPRFDPHGDPIPTASGELPSPRGISLTDLPRGEVAEIVHLEDEPGAIFAQLVAQRLHPGMQVRMLDSSPERIRIVAEGDEIFLAPVVAANVTVVPLAQPGEVAEKERVYRTLSELSPGEEGKVTALSRALRGLQRRRLMDLGIVPGTVIRAEMRSAAGDPTAYKIRGATIALRKSQSDLIYIEKRDA